jgi:hypothetical protein
MMDVADATSIISFPTRHTSDNAHFLNHFRNAIALALQTRGRVTLGFRSAHTPYSALLLPSSEALRGPAAH